MKREPKIRIFFLENFDPFVTKLPKAFFDAIYSRFNSGTNFFKFLDSIIESIKIFGFFSSFDPFDTKL